MSEYQCYEFLALDRPLTAKQIAELRAVSTRADITPTRLWNEYQYGNLKADPTKLMERYFDAHLYFANWGTSRLMLRVPVARVDDKTLREYFQRQSRRCLRSWIAGDHLLLEVCSDPESPAYYEEDHGSLAGMTALRTELMCGDHRIGYLAWLVTLQASEAFEVDDDCEEPPVPAGLAELTAAQEAMVEFLRIDADLLAVAAEGSSEAPPDERDAARRWLAGLTARAKDDWLRRAIDDPNLQLGGEMLREFRAKQRPKSARVRRTVRELRQAAEAHRERRLQAEAARAQKAKRAAAAARSKHLDALSKRLDGAWADLERLVTESAYDEALRLAVDLRDLATRDGEASAFARCFEAMRKRQLRRRGFFDRWKRANESSGR